MESTIHVLYLSVWYKFTCNTQPLLKKNKSCYIYIYREREREIEKERERECVCVCVCEREREREIVDLRRLITTKLVIKFEKWQKLLIKMSLEILIFTVMIYSETT